jgi:sterol desaturase/sphingolipid hydroxylase (fatty acid hydroxylase superfamily)
MRPDRRSGIGPVSAYKCEQAAISRRTLYPVTAFYTAAAAILLFLGLSTRHLLVMLPFFALGIVIFTLSEYMSHRWVFHRHWKQSKKWYKKFGTYLTHRYLDPTHFGHHEKPFDGTHINGRLKDLLPIFFFLLPLSLLFPLYTAPATFAAIMLSYVSEEWIHHSEHYYNFNNRYFRHIKKYHLYHHSSQGIDAGYGITSAFWDVVFQTRFPPNVRQRLFGRGRYSRLSGPVDQCAGLNNTQGLQ